MFLMIYNAIFILLAFGLTSLYLNKGGVAVFVGLAFILSLVQVVLKRRTILQTPAIKVAAFNKPILFLTGFLAVALISSFYGINPEYSVSKWFQLLGVTIVGLSIYGALRYAKTIHFEKFMMYCYWALGFFSVWALVDHLKISPEFTTLIHGENLRLTKFSSVLAIVLPFAIGYTMSQSKKVYWIVPFLGVTASVACGGRSGWLALFVMLLTLYMFYPWETVKNKRANRHLYKFISLIAPVLGLLIYKGFVGVDTFVRRATLAAPEGVGSGRLGIWEFALQNWWENPILGIGVKGFRHLDFSGVELTSHLHPHNAIVEILLETGLIGLAFAMAFVIAVMGRLIKTLYANVSFTNPVFHITAICSLVGFAAYGAASLTLTSIFHAYWLSYAVVLIVLMEVSRLNIIRKQHADYEQGSSNAQLTENYPVAVSVIMPCYNGEKFIAEAIESVQRQTFENWELIISNDGSSDKSGDIIDNYAQADNRIRHISREKGVGAAEARNKAIEVANGRFVAFLDSDDMWTDDKLEKQIAFMYKTGAALSGTHYHAINEESKVTGSITPSKNYVTYFSLLKANDIGCLTAMYDVEKLGKLYMKKMTVGEDLQLWLDILKKTSFAAIIHQKLGYYRIHSASVSYNKIKSIKMRWKMILKEKEVGYVRGCYYFLFYAINGVLKSLKSQIL